MLEIDESLLQTEPDCRAGLGHSNFILRTPSVSDLETLVRLATDPILAKNLCDAWLPTTMRAADAWLEHMVEDKDPTRFTFVLTDMQGTNLGAAAVMLDDDRIQAEVSIVICRDQCKRAMPPAPFRQWRTLRSQTRVPINPNWNPFPLAAACPAEAPDASWRNAAFSIAAPEWLIPPIFAA